VAQIATAPWFAPLSVDSFSRSSPPNSNIPIWVIQDTVLKLRPVSKSAFTQSNDEFRALLKELRVSKGLTQADVAEKLRLPQSYVSKIETGERRMDFVETGAFCDAIGVELAAFARLFSERVSRGRVPARRGTK